ncbi:MAG: radical SAM protein [Theionarchaea archaeon]|nr:radical SAM protein [Theionarchaea archaeon]
MMKLHLHANFPYDYTTPNAALGYLKSYLAPFNHEVTNTYWYIPPREIFEAMRGILARFQKSRISLFDPSIILTAYLSRFFYRAPACPTMIQSIVTSCASPEELEQVGLSYKGFVDTALEDMADVDIAGFTLKFYQWILNCYIWRRLKQLNPNITIVIGGLDTREEAVKAMETFRDVDCAIWGEGECPLRELITRDTDGMDEVPRLIYRKRGDLCITDITTERVREYPFADHTDYFRQLRQFDLDISPQIPMFTTRSCRWDKCKFCNENKGISYFERSIDETIREIEYQTRTHGVDRIVFLDADIGRKTERDFKNLLEGLLHSVDTRGAPYDMVADISPQRLTRETVQMMSKIRMGVQIGFEALTDSLLRKMNKRHSFLENIQALKVAYEYGLKMYGLNVLRNLPGETEHEVMESMEQIKGLRFFLREYPLHLSELTLYKRAPYFKEISPEERETRWVVNFLYDEMCQQGLLNEEGRWDFFGFRARDLIHHNLWDQVATLLERVQSETISYTWQEHGDGSVLIENNQVTGDKKYVLTRTETDVLKFCDSVVSLEQVEERFPDDDISDILSQLRKEAFLYLDERNRVISILSARKIVPED